MSRCACRPFRRRRSTATNDYFAGFATVRSFTTLLTPFVVSMIVALTLAAPLRAQTYTAIWNFQESDGCCQLYPGLLAQAQGQRRPDAVDLPQGDVGRLVVGDVHPEDTRHGFCSLLTPDAACGAGCCK